jgi:hypothetical protein
MSKYKSPLLNLLQKKSRIYLDGINEEELEEKQFYSRRKFLDTSLKSSLALGLATSVPLFNSCKNNSSSSNASSDSLLKPKVVIIGAGISGLTAGTLPEKIRRSEI